MNKKIVLIAILAVALLSVSVVVAIDAQHTLKIKDSKTETIKTTVEELSKLINIDNVIGEPIDAGDKILIPVMRMGVGFATGTVKGDKCGAGAGAGAGVEPISMVVIPKEGNTSEELKVINITKGSEMNKAISDLGLLVSDIVKKVMDKHADDDDIDESEYIEPETINV